MYVLQELRDSFKLNLYILVSRVFTDPSAPADVPKKKQRAVSTCVQPTAARKQLACSQMQYLCKDIYGGSHKSRYRAIHRSL